MCFLLMILLIGLCSGQEVKNNQIKFIRVYSTQSFPTPPFTKQEIEISNNQICYRTVLPPREKVSKDFLKFYDSWEPILKRYKQVESLDYDSIVNFILTSGLLKVDLNYMKPDSTTNIIAMNIGGGSVRYIIETSLGNLDLTIFGLYNYKLPETLVNFDRLFNRISRRYDDLKK